MKVLLLSKYPRMGASSRLRSLQYIPELNATGIDVRVSSLFDERYLQTLYSEGKRLRLRCVLLYLRRLWVVFGIFRYDLVWIEYEVFPYCPALVERLLRWLGKPYVVDYDDAVFHNYDMAANVVVRKVLGKKIDTVMRNAACVVVGNEYLAERARKVGARRIEIIPTVVDHTRYQCATKGSAARPVIGWIGTPATQAYVVGIRDALRTVCESTGARLLLVGATANVTEQIPGMLVDVMPWSEAAEADLIRQMHVGIMPLQDGPWDRGKCGYKLIQYMASGVPVVASPVGVNVDIVNQGRCGRLAESTQDWAEALTELLSSEPLRQSFGSAGRKAVEQRYSLQVQAPVLAGIFQSITKQGRA